MIGVSITVSLKGAEEEEKFLGAFSKAMEHLDHIEGLEDFKAAKVIGKDFTYHVFSLWASEEAIEAWLAFPIYRDVIRKGGEDLVASFESYRWTPIREPHRIP
ncbi:MAG TPA: antibiotic biosynthesis monooxygenase [Thermoanaerobaculia bacterium]|nr:antibiotic biosynthesis monooxygenase [Thermoanaerobaculia bacterium]HUM29137.1 antibiotic biosynthesis monooxygenase [Thermoanaerobaculia bacterium]HXK67514.1 antibiotic biosynthesis monooxygenase [Thermoanaerobaculia bacterium]